MPNRNRPFRIIDRCFVVIVEATHEVRGWVTVRDAQIAKTRLKPQPGEAIYVRLAEPKDYE